MADNNLGKIERKAVIFNIQKYNMYDGPGIRTIVFFKGCPLRCKWCSNPESFEKKNQVMYKKNNCIDCGACVKVCPVGVHSMVDNKHIVNRHVDCIGCRKCEKACLNAALRIVGEERTISDIMEVIEEDRAFYDASGGGVTLSGGEVLMQMEAATNLLLACKQAGINTAIETTGYANSESLFKLAEFVDLFLFDVKQMDPKEHQKYVGVNNELILHNLEELLKRKFNVKIRIPLLQGINNGRENIDKLLEFLYPYKDYKNFKGIDLLPYHKMGVSKYEQLDIVYPLEGDPKISETELGSLESYIKSKEFEVYAVRH